MSKIIFMKYLPHVRPKLVPKLKTLKIGSFDISNIPTSILMSKIISIKYLPLGRPKLVAKLNLEFTEIRHIRYFKYANLDFNVRNGFYEIFTSCQAKLTPRLNLLWNFCLIF